MEHIKEFITTLVIIMIFITAVEIIAPDNSIKKYIKFVLGLILVAAMLNPIIYIFTKGEKDLIEAIQNYENMFYEGFNEEISSNTTDEKIASFKNNLNNNCNVLLKNEFEKKNFTSNVICTLNLEEMTYDIEKIQIGVEDTGIKLVEKINININESEQTISGKEYVEDEGEIKKYLAEVFNIPEEKIEIYKLKR